MKKMPLLNSGNFNQIIRCDLPNATRLVSGAAPGMHRSDPQNAIRMKLLPPSHVVWLVLAMGLHPGMALPDPIPIALYPGPNWLTGSKWGQPLCFESTENHDGAI